MGVARLAVLPVLGQQHRDDIDRFLSGARPLEPEAQQVHAEQTGVLSRLALVKTASLPMDTPCSLTPISAPPDPVRLGQDHRVRVGIWSISM